VRIWSPNISLPSSRLARASDKQIVTAVLKFPITSFTLLSLPPGGGRKIL